MNYYDMNFDDSVGWPYTWDGAQLNGVWYDVPITLRSNDIDLHKDVYEQKNYKPTDTVEEISQLVIDETGYDENQPVQITNKDKTKKKKNQAKLTLTKISSSKRTNLKTSLFCFFVFFLGTVSLYHKREKML